MVTAARKAAASKPAETPTETPKARASEFDRAEAAYSKAKAKTDKSAEKLESERGKVAELELTYEADKRTSDYLYMHPALAEARAKSGGPVGSIGGTASGTNKPVEAEVEEPGHAVPSPATTDDEWEAAKPEPVTPAAPAEEADPFGASTPTSSADYANPFAGTPETSSAPDPFSSPFD